MFFVMTNRIRRSLPYGIRRRLKLHSDSRAMGNSRMLRDTIFTCRQKGCGISPGKYTGKYHKEATPTVDKACEALGPVLTEESLAVMPESSVPSLREEMGPALRLELVPISTQELVPALRGELVPVSTQQLVPDLREESAPVLTEELVSVLPESMVPGVREELAPCTSVVALA